MHGMPVEREYNAASAKIFSPHIEDHPNPTLDHHHLLPYTRTPARDLISTIPY